MAKKIRPTVVGISGSADIRSIADCHTKLLQALRHEKALQLDLSGLTDADLTFVQLIESARRFGAAQGKAISLAKPADNSLHDILSRGGFLRTTEDKAFWLHEKGTN